MLREAINEFRIVGILSEIDLKYGSYMKNGTSTEYIGGSIVVKVPREDGDWMETVRMFSNKYKKDGTVSPAYESIERIMKEYVSIAAAGNEADADRVSITGGRNTQIRVNDFVGRNGDIVSDPQLTASFVNKVTGEFKPEASFNLEFVLNSMHRVCDADGVELDPAKLELQVIVPIYGEKVQVMKLYAKSPNSISFIENNWESGKTYKVYGDLSCNVTTVEKIEEQAFGEPIKKTYTNSTKEFVLKSGSDAYDDDMAFDIAEIQKAVAARKVELEQKKNSPKAAPAPAAAVGKAGLDLGF